MSNLPEIDTPFLLDFLTKLLNTPSPTGIAEAAIALTEETLKAFPALTLARTRKGALTATWRGDQDEGPRAVTAHVDTLGADGQGGQVQWAAETVQDRRLSPGTPSKAKAALSSPVPGGRCAAPSC